MELADETELVSLAVGYRAVDRWKKMILLIYSLKQKQTRKRVIDWGAQPIQSSKLSSKKSRCPKETNTVTGKVLAAEHSQNIS